MHAEALPNDVINTSPVVDALKNKNLAGFIRFGNDFTNNFYQVELALKPTEFTPGQASGSSGPVSDPNLIWPKENEIDLKLSHLATIKAQSLKALPGDVHFDQNDIYFIEVDGLKIGIKGNPNIGFVRTLMLGVKNNSTNRNEHLRGEVWFNELRLAEMDNEGGMAAIASLDTNMADFMTLSATGRMGTIGFGALEQAPNERSREDMIQFDVVN